MPVFGAPRSFHNKFKFLFAIDRISYAGFQKVSEISAELATIAHYEGGTLVADKSPGRLTFPPITAERGSTQDLELYNWFEEGAKASAGLGGQGRIDPLYKRMAELVQLDRNDAVLQRWTLHEAYCSKFVAGEWDNNSDEKVITSVTIEYKFFEPAIRPVLIRL